jgi:metallo-beta-lactamase class B
MNDFEKSFAFLATAPCDILMTTHPEASGMWDRLQARDVGQRRDAFVDPAACRQLAERGREQLRQRIEAERKP